MTLGLVLAARKTDPCEYSEVADKFRGMFEILLFLCIMYNMVVKVYQFRSFRRYIAAYGINKKLLIF